MNVIHMAEIYQICRFDKFGTNKINPLFYVDLENKGYENIRFFSKDNTEVFSFEDDRFKYIILLGSNEMKDWIKNFLYFKKRIPYEGTNPKIKVHGGFMDMYLKVREEVLLEAEFSSKPLIVMGHSLGSALATLASLDIEYNTKIKPDVLFTGTPRVGNKYFVKSFNNRLPCTIRVVRGNDIVSHVPPRIFGFDHVGKLKKIGNKKSLHFIRDHFIQYYKECF
jgi:predicted lipase